MITKKANLQQVKEARLKADFDDRYGAVSGPWTTNAFVEAVYTSLKSSVKLAFPETFTRRRGALVAEVSPESGRLIE
jgi:hypothetical protein